MSRLIAILEGYSVSRTILGIAGLCVILFLAYALFYFFKHVPLHLEVSQPVRQNIPSPTVLELPPPAPVTPSVSPLLKSLAPLPIEETVQVASSAKKAMVHQAKKVHIPSKIAIINQYRQVIELDQKYYQVAVDSDRYGYKNQALIYYKKYLTVSPSGPHAGEVRLRLAELESSF